MLLTGWLVIVAHGTLATALALLTDDDGIAIFAGIVGFLAYGIASFGAFDLVVISNGTELQRNEWLVSGMLLTLSVIPGWIALTGPVNIIRRVREPEAREV